jgi:hypothetical protein
MADTHQTPYKAAFEKLVITWTAHSRMLDGLCLMKLDMTADDARMVAVSAESLHKVADQLAEVARLRLAELQGGAAND